MKYIIKSTPEDFFVKEIISLKSSDSGIFSYYTMKKKGISTIEAAAIVCQKLKIPRKRFGFAGTKDRISVSEQAVSVEGGAEKDFDFGNITLEFIGKGSSPINLGDNSGNYFEIILRQVKESPKEKDWFINYFDDQRFSNNNEKIGKAIIKKEFRHAVDLILQNNKSGYERSVKQHIEKNPSDFIGAMRKIDTKILRMYVHAFQSYLWNRKVSGMFSSENSLRVEYSLGTLNVPAVKPKNCPVEIPGFGSEKISEEDISPRDFIVREIPGISSEGDSREILIDVNDLKIENNEKEILKLYFTLPKGSYATMFIKQLFSGSS